MKFSISASFQKNMSVGNYLMETFFASNSAELECDGDWREKNKIRDELYEICKHDVLEQIAKRKAELELEKQKTSDGEMMKEFEGTQKKAWNARRR